MAEYTPIWFDDEDVAGWLEDHEDDVRDILQYETNADDSELDAIVERLKNETPALAKGLNDEILTHYGRVDFVGDNMPNVIYAVARGDGPVSLD